MLTCISTAQARTKWHSAFWAQVGARHFSCKFPSKVPLVKYWSAFQFFSILSIFLTILFNLFSILSIFLTILFNFLSILFNSVQFFPFFLTILFNSVQFFPFFLTILFNSLHLFLQFFSILFNSFNFSYNSFQFFSILSIFLTILVNSFQFFPFVLQFFLILSNSSVNSKELSKNRRIWKELPEKKWRIAENFWELTKKNRNRFLLLYSTSGF